jgi:ornithine carbamoyltransferase
MIVSCPEGYEPNKNFVEYAERVGIRTGAEFKIIRKPEEAVKEADIIYTDTWVSMGQEKEKNERLKAFRGYQVNSKLLEKAKNDFVVMHCLPAHRGFEITDEVLDGKHSIVWEQAKNRMHVQKALLYKLFSK